MRKESPQRLRVRFLWDENLSRLVAEALRVLQFNVTWVGAPVEGVPPSGTTDRALVEYAQGRNQIIVTSNHDMMTLCHEQGQRFVWLDPRSKQMSRQVQVVVVFQQIAEWERMLTADPPTCVHAMRSTCRAISSGEAARLATSRMRAIERRKRPRRSVATRSDGAVPIDGL